MNTAIELDSATRKAIAVELRTFNLLGRAETQMPLPAHDLDAEERIVSEALYGAPMPQWFDVAWCYSPFVRSVLEITGAMHSLGKMPAKDQPLPIATIAGCLGKCGFRADATSTELLSIAQRCTHTSVDEECRTIRKLHFRRRALDGVRALDALLRNADATEAEIKRETSRIMAELEESRA